METPQTHYLYPAALFASRTPCTVTTILGSCISVCLWDSTLGIGGINHYMLPLWNGQGLPSPKYGNIAIQKLVQKMVSLGSDPKNLSAKIIGGAEILLTENDQFHVGTRNMQLAFDMMKEMNIPVVAHSVGGISGRKIQYHTKTGKVSQVLIENKHCVVRQG